MPAQTRALVLTDLWRPRDRVLSAAYTVALIASGATLIALSAQIVLPLPFTPVPVTAQTLTVILVGVLLGSRRGSLAALAYIAGGALGLPVFAAGGFGLARLLGPTGGYLLGFVAAAFVVGWLAERGFDRRLVTAAVAMLAGLAVIFACGLLWLGLFVGYQRVLALGLLPFLMGEAVKLCAAAVLLPLGWRLLGRRSS